MMFFDRWLRKYSEMIFKTFHDHYITLEFYRGLLAGIGDFAGFRFGLMS